MSRIKCAVVGLKHGLETVYVLLNHDQYDLKVVCDIDREPYTWITGEKQVQRLDQEFGTSIHTRELVKELSRSQGAVNITRITFTYDYAEILRREDIDAVFLFVPDALHEEFSIAALRAGKYVLCTKPMALTIPSAKRIADVAQEFPHHYMLGFQFTYSPFARRVMGEIQDGKIGTVRQMSIHHHRGQFRPIYRKQSISRGPIVQECCHWFDLLYLFSGHAKFTKVAAFGGLDMHGDTQDIEDNGAIIVEYENKLRAALLFTYFRETRNSEFFTINGEKGQIRGSFDRITLENDDGVRVIEIRDNKKLPGLVHEGYYQMHDEFVAMIRQRRESSSGWESGMENTLISDAAQIAINRGDLVLREESVSKLITK